MCGRYGLTNPLRLTESGFLQRLGVERVASDVPAELTPRFNIAPGSPVLAAFDVRRDGKLQRSLAMARWGLVPRWATEASAGNRLANARSETLARKPAFRAAWERGQRCAVIADVFYEWQSATPRKQPWAIRLAGGPPFALAGLWERWRDPALPDAPPLVTCTVITTQPNALVTPVHHRMPVVLTGDELSRWVDRDVAPSEAAALMTPFDAGAMEAWTISHSINSPGNDGPEVLREWSC